jgi:hypothetical protein
MRPRFAAAAALVVALSLAACGTPAYDRATAQSLREHVLTVSTMSAAGDWGGALGALETMAAELSAAREQGKVDDERFDSIVLAMEPVRQDLESAVAAAETEAERLRLMEEQARLQEQITELQTQGDDEKKGEDDKKGEDEKEGDGEKKGEGGDG